MPIPTPELVVRANFPGYVFASAPRNVYWEMTLACDLACQHCRANAMAERAPGELNTEEGMALLRDVREMGSMVVLTGGDPMKRGDLFELIAYARRIGLSVAITPSTTPRLTRDVVAEFSRLGVAALGMSLDGPSAQVHDSFRGVAGTFERAIEAFGWAREFRIPVQVNTTVASETIEHLPELYRLLVDRARPPVSRWSLFLLVAVGRGKALSMPSAERIDELFEWVYDTSLVSPFHMTTVEAPHYRRYWIERRLREGMPHEDIEHQALRMGFGVRDGNGVVFVSHQGDVYPAGFLASPLLGNVKSTPLSRIYAHAPPLAALRNPDGFEGKCGVCEYRWACGGSRARAFATSGNALGSDPSCSHVPFPA